VSTNFRSCPVSCPNAKMRRRYNRNLNKVRIIASYILFREGVPDEDRRRLYQHARLSMAEQDAVNALVYLGVRISRGPGDRDLKRKLKTKQSQDEEYDLSRYKPLIRTVLEDHASGKLDDTAFPYVKDAPLAGGSLRSTAAATPPPPTTSLRSAKANWHKAPRPNAPTSNRSRLLVFMAGGMTYSEMREVYQLSAPLNKDIIIGMYLFLSLANSPLTIDDPGSTHTITPREFVDDLKVLELAGVGSRACPNGLRDPPAKRPFQEYYDERYFLKDAPPPQPRAPPAQSSRMPPPSQRPGQISQSASYASSTGSLASSQATSKEEKSSGKLKKKLFRF
jgi:syntaxin-binding protein 1